MNAEPFENMSWVVTTGDAVIQKKSITGMDGLSSWEKLIYCLWIADYVYRNSGDLSQAPDLYPDYKTQAVSIAEKLNLPKTREAFSLPTEQLEKEYYDRFDAICEEIKSAGSHQ